MKRSRVIFTSAAVIMIGFSILTFYGHANNISNFDILTATFSNHIPAPDPYGKRVTFADVSYPNNSDKEKSYFKKESDISGFIPDEELRLRGGIYTRKSLMTYKEYINLGIDEGIRHDIDPERMVWVFTSKFDKTHYIESKPIEKANVTTLYDAETGDFLSVVVTSDNPDGLKALSKR